MKNNGFAPTSVEDIKEFGKSRDYVPRFGSPQYRDPPWFTAMSADIGFTFSPQTHRALGFSRAISVFRKPPFRKHVASRFYRVIAWCHCGRLTAERTHSQMRFRPFGFARARLRARMSRLAHESRADTAANSTVRVRSWTTDDYIQPVRLSPFEGPHRRITYHNRHCRFKKKKKRVVIKLWNRSLYATALKTQCFGRRSFL